MTKEQVKMEIMTTVDRIFHSLSKEECVDLLEDVADLLSMMAEGLKLEMEDEE